MSRFEATNQEARQLEVGRAVPARLLTTPDRLGARMLCGRPRCGEEFLFIWLDMDRKQQLTQIDQVQLDLDPWHQAKGIWERGREHRQRRRRLAVAGLPAAAAAAQRHEPDDGGLGRRWVTLPAFFRCPRHAEHLTVLRAAEILDIIRT